MDSAGPPPRVHQRSSASKNRHTRGACVLALWDPPSSGQRIRCFTSISASIDPSSTVTTQFCWWAHEGTHQPYWHHLHRHRRTQYAPGPCPCAHASCRTWHISRPSPPHPILHKSSGACCCITCMRRVDSNTTGTITTSLAACSGQQRAPRADGGAHICNPSGHTGRPGLLYHAHTTAVSVKRRSWGNSCPCAAAPAPAPVPTTLDESGPATAAGAGGNGAMEK